jgi:hypothetical protein
MLSTGFLTRFHAQSSKHCRIATHFCILKPLLLNSRTRRDR